MHPKQVEEMALDYFYLSVDDSNYSSPSTRDCCRTNGWDCDEDWVDDADREFSVSHGEICVVFDQEDEWYRSRIELSLVDGSTAEKIKCIER